MGIEPGDDDGFLVESAPKLALGAGIRECSCPANVVDGRDGEGGFDEGIANRRLYATKVLHRCFSEHDRLGDVVDGGCTDAAEQASWHSADDSGSEEVVKVAVVVSVAGICAIEVVPENAVGVESAFADGVGQHGIGCSVVGAQKKLFVFGICLEEDGEVVEALSCWKIECVGVEPEDRRGSVVVIAEIDLAGSADLLDVTQGGSFFCGIFCLSEDREQDCGEDCDDGNDDQKLDKRECALHEAIF